MKTKVLIFAFLITPLFFLFSCSKDKNNEFPGTLELSAAPNPVTAIVDGNKSTWNFSVKLLNKTKQAVTLGPVYDSVYATDTQYTGHWIYDGWSQQGLLIPADSSYTGNHYFYHTMLHSGKYDFKMTAKGKDGKNYEAKITIILNP
jgi:hypothetical protein